MAFYQQHLFVCNNRREDGTPCCAMLGASEAKGHLKKRAKEAGIHEPGGVRINSAGCMGRCDEGPVIVIYPEGVWYTYVDSQDLDEIFEEHLLAGRPVERLRLPGKKET
ncbi:MAG: (2Fe-2S) ferredoxin domain-containing protein [Gammaproteobacteria bacterium]|nr:(2Fe-2S) ferredoxin domain-containing protein [Gammaproteobacteria bacterium]MBU1654728.1 (2Fe-2S) ferredoxin domain-containing protein [Gammaproteobacteria bacterium]MBU1959649.1 (2Fe-2S) ferredoxin domain-containing protein [Gammaproteobacteria bacterium]